MGTLAILAFFHKDYHPVPLPSRDDERRALDSATDRLAPTVYGIHQHFFRRTIPIEAGAHRLLQLPQPQTTLQGQAAPAPNLLGTQAPRILGPGGPEAHPPVP